MSVVFLDGKPGVGKSYVAQKVFQDIFRFHHFDGDTVLPENEIASIRQGRIPTHEMRHNHIIKILDSLGELNKKHSNIIITHAFMKNFYRQLALKNVKNAIFVLVKCDEYTRGKRLESRQNHIVTGKFAERLDSEFEEPSFPFWTIYNEVDGIDELLKQVSVFFSTKEKL